MDELERISNISNLEEVGENLIYIVNTINGHLINIKNDIDSNTYISSQPEFEDLTKKMEDIKLQLGSLLDETVNVINAKLAELRTRESV